MRLMGSICCRPRARVFLILSSSLWLFLLVRQLVGNAGQSAGRLFHQEMKVAESYLIIPWIGNVDTVFGDALDTNNIETLMQ